MPQAQKESNVPGNDKEVNVLDGDAEGLVVNIVDDTPPEDRGRKPLEHDPLSKQDDDDEAAKYTKGVQKRIKELTHKAHDERRRAEAAEREKEEAVNFARAAYSRAKALEQQLTSGEAAFSNTTVEKEELALKTAKEDYTKAYEAGDPVAQAEATAKVAAASQRLENAKHWAAQAKQKSEQKPLHAEKDVVDSDQRDVNTQRRAAAPQVAEPDSAAMEWGERNPWFGKNRKMTSYVYGIHEELTLDKGLRPVEDAEEYFAAIDKEMRERFPDYEWDQEGEDDVVDAKPAKKTTAKKPAATVVAPVSRTPSGSGKEITLSKSEVAIAKSFGLTPQQYALEKVKLNKGAA